MPYPLKVTKAIESFFNRALNLFTIDSENARVKVDVGQTGFFDGRQFRLYLIISSPIVVKFTSPVDFILQEQVLSSNDGIATFAAYRSDQGSAAGVFDGAVNTFNNNQTSTVPPYAGVITQLTGGSFTPDAGSQPLEIITVKAATSNNRRQTVGGGSIAERGLSAGTYYLKFTGSDAEYNLIYEERP